MFPRFTRPPEPRDPRADPRRGRRRDRRVARAGRAAPIARRIRCKTYSLGMKQRLAIAATLLRDPSLLILDEPANGLDPAGIVEVRELLRSLGAEGRTIFVSSHILSEVQQTADHVAIVAQGQAGHGRAGGRGAGDRPGRGLLVKLGDLRGRPSRARGGGRPGCRCAGDALRVDVPPEQSGARQPHARRGRSLRDRAPPRRGRSRDRVPRAHEGPRGGRLMRLLRSEFLRARSRRLVPMVIVARSARRADQPGDRRVLRPRADRSVDVAQAQAAVSLGRREVRTAGRPLRDPGRRSRTTTHEDVLRARTRHSSINGYPAA